MKEKKPLKIKFKTVVVLIIIAVLLVIGGANVYVSTHGYGNIFTLIKYKITGEKNEVTDKNESLSDKAITKEEEKESNLNNTDNVSILVIEGRYHYINMPNADPPEYIFHKDGKVEAEGNDILKGTYKIENNIITIKYTTKIYPEGYEESINTTEKFKYIDSNTLMTENNKLTLIKSGGSINQETSENNNENKNKIKNIFNGSEKIIIDNSEILLSDYISKRMANYPDGTYTGTKINVSYPLCDFDNDGLDEVLFSYCEEYLLLHIYNNRVYGYNLEGYRSNSNWTTDGTASFSSSAIDSGITKYSFNKEKLVSTIIMESSRSDNYNNDSKIKYILNGKEVTKQQYDTALNEQNNKEKIKFIEYSKNMEV